VTSGHGGLKVPDLATQPHQRDAEIGQGFGGIWIDRDRPPQ